MYLAPVGPTGSIFLPVVSSFMLVNSDMQKETNFNVKIKANGVLNRFYTHHLQNIRNVNDILNLKLNQSPRATKLSVSLQVMSESLERIRMTCFFFQL